MEFSIIDLFKPEELRQKGDGNYQTICPDCGLQGGRTEGFILFTDTNKGYCHSSKKSFNLLETFALKKKLIKCLDGFDKDENLGARILDDDDLFNETIEAFAEEYGEELTEEIINKFGKKVEIKLPGKNRLISKFVSDVINVFKTKKCLFYRSETSEIVEIGKVKTKEGVEFKGFIPIKPNRLITLLERYVIPGNIEKKIIKNDEGEVVSIEEKFVARSITAELANTTLCSQELQEALPLLKTVLTVPMPIIYEGKLTFPKKGYDERFYSWLPYNAPDISDPNMSLEDAKKLIYQIHSEFCFKSKQDYTNAVASLITMGCSGLFSRITVRTPCFSWIANREGAGKDYGAAIRPIVYTGQSTEDAPISTSENKKSNHTEELRKKLTSAMLAGKTYLHFSNNKGFVDNAVFEQALTSEIYSDRMLGKNITPQFSNIIYFSLSGNVGIGFTPDLMRRLRFVRLFYDAEDVNSRKFANSDLHGWLKDNRSLVLSAIYALIRNWIEKGSKPGSVTFTSFPEWARVVGGIMEAAGYDSPCAPDVETLGLNPDSETADMKELFEIMYAKYPDTYIKRDVIKETIEAESSLFANIDFTKKADQIRFSNKLTKFVGRVLSDIRLNVKDPLVRGARQEFVFTKEKKTFDNKEIFEESVNLGQLGQVGQVAHNLNLQNNNNYHKTIVKHDQHSQHDQKSDRDVQFYDANECYDIKPNHTKEDILEFIKTNSAVTYQTLYSKFGVGCLKFKNELLSESKITQNPDGGYSFNG